MQRKRDISEKIVKNLWIRNVCYLKAMSSRVELDNEVAVSFIHSYGKHFSLDIVRMY